jgi:hypothetical protein
MRDPRIIRALPPLLALAIAACATVPPGEDEKGTALRGEGTAVLLALIQYQKAKGHYPSSLYELVPTYIAQVPFEPHLRFDEDSGTLQFTYELEWPRQAQVSCLAKVGATEWSCAG